MAETSTHPTVALTALLDEAYTAFAAAHFFDGMVQLTAKLANLRQSVGVAAWGELARTVCDNHPVREVLHQDPFTVRAFQKPRGYAGDAVMLDYMYQAGTVIPPGTSTQGQGIFRYTTNGAPPRAVRYRRFMIAEVIDGLAARIDRPAVLALAAGHLREAELSQALRAGHIGPYFALDQDAHSLAVVEEAYGHLGVRPLHATVRDLLTKSSIGFVDEQFDLVYAAGLFDYLVQPTAQRLVARMWSLIKPGGQIIIANFLPDLLDIAYMESFMDWHLIYRTAEELQGCCDNLPIETIAQTRVWTDPEAQMVFLQAMKCT